MNRITKITKKLRTWKKIFFRGVVRKTNIGRDTVIILLTIIFLGSFLWVDHYRQNNQNGANEPTVLPAKKTVSEQKRDEQKMCIADDNTDDNHAKETKPKKEKIKTTAPEIITEPIATGPSCIKIPTKILAGLKDAPTPPDGKMKDGKLICHVLAAGKKDHPHKSVKNPKGEWGGCCYDPNEVPNPHCCYPIGSVYEKPLNDYFNNPFPLRK